MSRRSAQGLWYVVPAGLVYLPLVAVPLAYSLVLSLHEWNGLAADWKWAGLRQYAALLRDDVFWLALAHNFALVAVSVVGQLPLALGLALLVHRAGRWTGLARTALFVPYVLPTVVIALVWRLLVVQAAPALLGSMTWSLPVVMVAITWRFVGFHMVLYLAGLAAIDPELEDAARLDGAGGWTLFRHVTLPLLKPVLMVSATLAIVGSMKYFDIVYVMTAGGPAHATELLATYMYKQGFEASRLGYASALAAMLTLLAIGGMGAVAWAGRPRRGAP